MFNDVDISHLDHEVKRILNNNKIQSPKLSIPASLLDEVLSHPITYPEIYKIYSHATRLLLISKGLILPGGSDIEPEFYGQAKSEFTETEPDYRRTLFEFSLFKIAFEKKLPILGICRGSQIGNVYLGGSLKQHVKNQKNVIQRISLAKHSQAREIFEGKKHIKGLSLHHQAYDQIGKGLKQVALYQDIPKILEGTTKQFLMLVQVHAEFLDENHLLFDRFVEVLNTSSPSDSHN